MAADGNITKDLIYDAVAPDDFESMLELDRYNARSTAFDKIISATHDHFWDPLDAKYIDFDEPFDMENTMILPEKMIGALQLDYVNEILGSEKEPDRASPTPRRCGTFSSILHGEQGALNLSASLCHVLKDQGAQEYAANQTREEARHVTAFAKYIKARWGRPVECGPILKDLLVEIIGAPEVYKKIIGMQMLVEGLAMGAFATDLQRDQRPAGQEADPAGDDRRGLPPQVREDLGRPHHPAPDRGRARGHRDVGGALLPDAAVQPGGPDPERRPLRGVRPRPEPGDRGDGQARRTTRPAARR